MGFLIVDVLIGHLPFLPLLNAQLLCISVCVCFFCILSWTIFARFHLAQFSLSKRLDLVIIGVMASFVPFLLIEISVDFFFLFLFFGRVGILITLHSQIGS